MATSVNILKDPKLKSRREVLTNRGTTSLIIFLTSELIGLLYNRFNGVKMVQKVISCSLQWLCEVMSWASCTRKDLTGKKVLFIIKGLCNANGGIFEKEKCI